MAKKSVIQRALKRERLVKKYAVKRAELKKTLSDPKVTEEAFYAAQRNLGPAARLFRECLEQAAQEQHGAPQD